MSITREENGTYTSQVRVKRTGLGKQFIKRSGVLNEKGC